MQNTKGQHCLSGIGHWLCKQLYKKRQEQQKRVAVSQSCPMLAIHRSLVHLLLGQEDGLWKREQRFSATLSDPTLLSFSSPVSLASEMEQRGCER